MNPRADFLQFFSGMIVMADLVAALAFLKFWRNSHDRLFAFFTAAFVLLAVQRSLLTLWDGGDAGEVLLYALRALAFVVIFVGIVDKNRASA